MTNFNADLRKKFGPIWIAVGFGIKDRLDPPKIDQTLTASSTGVMGDKDNFWNCAGAVAVDNRVFLRMQATTLPRNICVAAISQTAGIAVVPDSQNFSIIAGSDHRSDLKPSTR